MPTRLPHAPPCHPIDGMAFRWLVGSMLPRVREPALPEHVQDELVAAVACGDPEEGFLWMSCEPCGVHRLVATSCKGRGFCPRCGGRRMAQGAARLVDDVLPVVPVRQWVLSLPMRVRLALAWRPELTGRALAIVMSVLTRYYRGRTGGQGGAVTVIQRFGSALALNIHFHVLALDGGYVQEGERVGFVASRAPGRRTLSSMVRAMGQRLDRLVSRVEEDEPDEAQQLALWAAAGPGGGGARRPERRFEASWGWYSLEASRRTAARDREGLERLCRYVLRPAVSLSRLGMDEAGRVVMTLRHRWRDGTSALTFEREELVRRLAALVPPKGQHLVRYHGVLAPASRLRAKVVRRPRRTGPRWIRWAALVKRTFGVEAVRCPECGERMRERALVRRGAHELWMWLQDNAQRVLIGPPTRAGPGAESLVGTG